MIGRFWHRYDAHLNLMEKIFAATRAPVATTMSGSAMGAPSAGKALMRQLMRVYRKRTSLRRTSSVGETTMGT